MRTSGGSLGMSSVSAMVVIGLALSGCTSGATEDAAVAVAFANTGHQPHGGAPAHGHFDPEPGFGSHFHHGFNPHPGQGGFCSGHGGTVGTGGAGGVGGTGGTGGSTPPPMACLGTPVASPVITDFSDAVAGSSISFGTPPGLTGGTFSYSGTGLTAPALALTTVGSGMSAEGLQVSASPGATADGTQNFFGFGLFFNSCLDASAFSGVKFTIAGDLGNCGISFATTFSETVSPTDDTRGACTLASCFPGSFPLTSTGTIIVPFSALSGGSPSVIDPKSIIGVQWQMNQPLGAACVANFTISDVEFTSDAPPPPPPPVCPAPPTALLTGSPVTVAAPNAFYAFSATGLAAPSVTPTFASDSAWQGLDVTLAPGVGTDPANAFLGFGVPLFGCVDATDFTGVRFTINGDLGTCPLQLGLVARDDNSTTFGGGCTASLCLAPTSPPLATGVNTVHFSDLTGGSPDPGIDPSALDDIQWQLNVPTDGITAPCNATFSITDISFVND